MSRYYVIAAHREAYGVRLLCQVVGVPVSGYYARQKTKQQAVNQLEPADAWYSTACIGQTADTAPAPKRAPVGEKPFSTDTDSGWPPPPQALGKAGARHSDAVALR
jgi:hypothetical protein